MEEIEINKSSSGASSKHLSRHINLKFQGGRKPFVTNRLGQKKLTGTFFQGKPRKTARARVIYINNVGNRRLHGHQLRNTHSRINMTTRYSNRNPNTHGRADGPSKVYRKPILGRKLIDNVTSKKVISRNTHSVRGRRDQRISSKGYLTIDTQTKHNEKQYAEELCAWFTEIFPE